MYTIEFSPTALRDYKKLPENAVEGLNLAIDSLALNPRPSGYKKLKGRDAYRIRIGDYRIIYEIHDKILTIVIFRIRHRKDVYRDI